MYYLNDITINFGDRILFDRISFMIGKKDRIGLIGRNGAGKSTLLKVISGEVLPDDGQVEISNKTTIGYLRQEFELDESLTVLGETMTCFERANELDRELKELNFQLAQRDDYESRAYEKIIERVTEISSLMEHHDLTQLESEAIKVLNGLGFKDNELDKQVSEMSGGWKMRIELAKLLLQKPDILLLDEPTNHLDIESIMWLEKYLQTYFGIVILISHDTVFTENVCNRILELELGNLYDYAGTYSQYIEEKAKQREILISSYENQQKIIADKERTINRFIAKASKTKMAQSMRKQLEKMDRIEIPEQNTEVMDIKFAEVPRSGREVVKAKNISKKYGPVTVLDEVDLTIERQDRVAFIGQNGQGKTTLAKILMEEVKPDRGEVIKGHNLHLSYYAQNQSELLDEKKTVLEVMQEKAPPQLRHKSRTILGSFMFSGDDADKKVSVLSGGERARLALASLVLHPSNLLILDEPTNHLDIQSKDILKKALLQYEGTLLVVSHDRDFLKGLTDKVVEFRDHKLNTYLGDIEYYMEKRKMDDMRKVEMKTETKASKPVVVTAKKVKLNHDEAKKLKRQLQYVERDIENLEKRKSALSVKLAEPDYYLDPDYVKTNKKLQEVIQEIEEKMEAWDTIAEQLI